LVVKIHVGYEANAAAAIIRRNQSVPYFLRRFAFGISIGARPAVDERGILDFEEQKSIRLSKQALGCPYGSKKREANRLVFLSTSECANDWSRTRGVFVAETGG